ncbi:hypothetical protein BCR34DRAFT_583057 [Clohesyomyces aquaticus]|uniref:Uncharacterized protein n=1 Tax=Clohesyomyces aquaticus TaxID=1231657 RepID=A0A1Y2A6I5_9PLEO|nr:hypothetical protein BCR34DRAFT_583057 [Clohesyomyces aquaticus]
MLGARHPPSSSRAVESNDAEPGKGLANQMPPERPSTCARPLPKPPSAQPHQEPKPSSEPESGDAGSRIHRDRRPQPADRSPSPAWPRRLISPAVLTMPQALPTLFCRRRGLRGS